MWKLLVGVLLCAIAFEDCRGELSNPCPDSFKYDVTDAPGRWVGTLNLVPDHKLYGAWVRLIFDGPVKGVDVADNLLEQKPLSSELPDNEVTIKNRDLRLPKGVITPVKFTVNYEGDKAPSLKAVRLNARYICPDTDEYEKLYQ